MRREQAFSVIPDDANIVARVAALASSQVPEAEQFRSLCEAVLGVKLSVILGESGQQLGTPLDRYRQITLETMGTGITSALNLLVSLSGAKGKIFLVEEPENDLHPSALKALLDAITEASGENQFIITTHSSIVLGRLGALTGSVVLKAETSTDNGLPTTTYQVAEGAAERLDILRHLGYELADFDLGEGWLIFEESSAERIAREYLIPWFAPGLARLRTLAAAGTSRVRPIMEDFREIFLFAHLESVYRNRAWVLVDGDPSGKQVINDLKVKFKTWNEENFRNLNGHALEYYYPPVFQQKAEDALAVEDKKKKKEAKKQLLHEVLSWVDEDPQRAKQEFQASAAEFISHLQEIEEKVLSMDRI
ncbi:ATP-dependent nuclease [Streptomyces sp. NPDC086082]|uniref:ATP-dependent nuclease n=1 Tax=Streptomyces sp. NPDC086082 TaxID=3365750 RepID=UPI0037F147B5